MERQKSSIIKPAIAFVIILLFHIVGIVGLSRSSTHVLFLKLVPWHILLMLLMVVLSFRGIEGKFFGFAAIIFCLGFGAEWIGVHKHWLFGNYVYGPTLGPDLFNIPIIIGINWFLLVFSAGVAAQKSGLDNKYLRILCGAAALVMLDVLIEPVAVKLNYWQWADNMIPPLNYLCWFLVSAVMLFIFELFAFKKQNRVAPVFLLTEFAFFGFLYLTL
ncbi:carotenoid biosynthesis protein [Mucilaginibacter segetis]|uniref:Carotenoid biosynthesis protein n=1 Tax=Mucilaginibacter segetis TaxID=2793071 RepID=A0A934PR39_9SPHI|nr:carotenoid biosynthesis protein [Mucilaginibacter segetis]MBK0377907.1 carotenoid biosynthesis protein [Mucilaginibacter segetis]